MQEPRAARRCSRLTPPLPVPPQPQVGATSGVQVVSQALVQRIREGVVPCLTGIGVDAVSGRWARAWRGRDGGRG